MAVVQILLRYNIEDIQIVQTAVQFKYAQQL